MSLSIIFLADIQSMCMANYHDVIFYGQFGLFSCTFVLYGHTVVSMHFN